MDAQFYIERAREICAKAEKGKRNLTTEERESVESCIQQTSILKLIDEQSIGGSGRRGRSGPSSSRLWEAVKATGLEPVPGQIVRKTVSVDGFGTKDLIAPGDEGEVLNRREGGVERIGTVERYSFPVFGVQPIDASTARVEYLRQSGRTLADPEDAVLDFASTDTKPETSTSVELVSDPPKMIATVSDYIPNAYLGRDDLRTLVEDTMQLALRQALDKHVTDSVLAVAVPSTDGADLIEQIVYAQQAVRDAGYEPNVTLLSSTDATSLVLARSNGPEEIFLLGNRPDLGQMRICSGVEDNMPIVLDSGAAGDLYQGGTFLDVDGFTKFDTNESRLRLEFPALFVVKQVDAIVQVNGTS